MTKLSTFGAIAVAVVALFSLSSCDNSPKSDNSSDEKPKVNSTLKIAYVEVDSIMTQYEFCKEYSLILEKKSQNIQNTLQQKGQALQAAANNFQQKLQQNAYIISSEKTGLPYQNIGEHGIGNLNIKNILYLFS